MILSMSPYFLGCTAPIYETAREIVRNGIFRGYYSMDIEADTAAGPTRALFVQTGLTPVSFRMVPGLDEEEGVFEQALARAPAMLEQAAEAGYRTATSWIFPGSDTMPPEQYRKRIVERLCRLREVLSPFGIPLGVELVAAKTRREVYRYPIGSTTKALLQLLAEAGGSGLGVCLDCFHAYSTGNLDAEYAAITDAGQLTAVHISDAIPGVPPAEQQDQDRRLPGETGVIDLSGLFRRLETLGYTGAVVLEPIDKRFARQPFAVTLQQAEQAAARVWPEGLL